VRRIRTERGQKFRLTKVDWFSCERTYQRFHNLVEWTICHWYPCTCS